MMLTTLLTLFVASLTVRAAPAPVLPALSVTCYTVSGFQGERGPLLSTTTSTRRLAPTTVTSTRTSTITLTWTPVITTTSTATSTSTATTTELGISSTFTSTITSTSTLSDSTTITSTVQTTLTDTTTSTATSTLTIAAPAGFTPIIKSSGYTSLNAPQRERREVLDRLFNLVRSPPEGRQFLGGGTRSAQGIKCVTRVQSTVTVYRTVTTTTTDIGSASTTTSTTTTTVATTSTVIPAVVTSTVSTTSTTIVTTTSTSIALTTNTQTTTETDTTTSTTSVYAACATNNILGPQVQNGQYVQGATDNDPNGVIAITTAASAYDCCVQCITSDALEYCQNAIFDADGTCNMLGGNQAFCANGQQANSGQVVLTTTSLQRFDINGPCGYLTS
ncbi:hypothetical protein AYL99_08567 [Fonsecaea erecta]|uniref:Apple domain-containing protein n=1 Tax=Fonsecaea erecta TaxID=1367422 RepID=A0A178ZDH3_9EURO|nr:hypothetical protein AYL99_08567 [Fonsecaea erecta]OAP57829.1 hypothetical protein AYL99_08567 [Fonsecaea erecta]